MGGIAAGTSVSASGSLARCGACLSGIGVLVPVMAPHDGVPDGTV
jgi:hypothetical protein